ncbi:LysR family transcriptional regulator [Modestobacter sp. DSM 44400]|uniref:LysR family transcriptional regulator n=1 Tax=Modestobacter sp. DSM 44400 TaxID=1550230 RepID=UPI0015878DF6|nr:LysR family transcriptional regulator [Modestobacter sp. DSM 44400]
MQVHAVDGQARTGSLQGCAPRHGEEGTLVDPHDLLVLLAVARARTYTAAATMLGVNHTTVARRVGSLERALGVRLVVSAVGGWELTSAGREALAAAEALESALSLLPGSDGRAADDDLHGLVRVSCTEVFGVLVVAPALAQLHVDHPLVSFELTSVTRPTPAYGPAADLDIGVTRPASRRLAVSKLADYELGLFATAEHLDRLGHPRHLAELAAHRPVYYVESMLQVVELDLLDRLFPQRAEVLGATSVLAQLEMTRSGAGIGLLPAYLAARSPDLVRVLPDEATVVLTYWMSGRPENLRRPEVRAAAAAIQARVPTVIPAPLQRTAD